jgi:uncharacterized protein YacL
MTDRGTTLIRIFVAIALAVAGYGAGSILWPDVEHLAADELRVLIPEITLSRFLVSISFALFGSAFGYVLAPFFVRPFHGIFLELRRVPPQNLMGGTVGLATGLLLSALLAIPIGSLPSPFGNYLPFLVALILGYLGMAVVGSNPAAYFGLVQNIVGTRPGPLGGEGVLLDTSVIIDGRVADVAETGFAGTKLIVPRFVLTELQQIADSPDTLRRNRGRRGLEVLNRLQQSTVVDVDIVDTDFPALHDVDRKLIRLAEERRCAVMTNDYNLNRVAEIQGIRVLNLNELANAVKTLLLPGEQMDVKIIQEGKEYGQGVGYLDDGTMVVVDHARDHVGSTLTVNVTRVLQTVAGRMIFASAPSLEREPEPNAART